MALTITAVAKVWRVNSCDVSFVHDHFSLNWIFTFCKRERGREKIHSKHSDSMNYFPAQRCSFYYTLTGYIGICPYIRSYVCSFVRVPTASLLYRRHFLTDVTKLHTRVHKRHLLYDFEHGHHRSHVTPLNRGLLPPRNGVTALQTSFLN